MNNCVSLNLRLCLSLHVGMDQFACLYDRHLKISSEALIFLSNEVDHQWEFVLQEFFERIIIALVASPTTVLNGQSDFTQAGGYQRCR